MHRLRPLLLGVLSALLGVSACGGGPPASSSTPASAPPLDDARGGRLFDAWATETRASFRPDARASAGQADGEGGPRSDGTLLLADGTPLLNDAGHDYRLKNFFGWDLRGRAGLYGPGRMDRSYASDDLLAWTGGVEDIADRLARGGSSFPAWGDVLAREDLEAVAAFVVGVRDGRLPRAEMIYALTTPEAGHYALRPGGDAARGRELYAARCAGCHGADGTARLFDDGAYSLGSHARQKAYEDWLKILNGQPGTSMGRQVRGGSAEAMAQELLDLFAALCDRTAFPAGAASAGDVPDDDPRCGAYLR